jgi:hypothetical protein
MAQVVSRRPLTVTARVHAWVNPVGFVVDKVALGQVFLWILRFSRQYHSTMCSTFQNFKTIHSSHSILHPFISSGDGQKARKSDRSPGNISLTPIIRIQVTSYFDSIYPVVPKKSSVFHTGCDNSPILVHAVCKKISCPTTSVILIFSARKQSKQKHAEAFLTISVKYDKC